MDADGRLYAGGYFQTAGGISAKYVAMWNGVAWSALGSGMDGAIAALAVDGSGFIYAGGEFTHAGGAPASHVARWDGFTWSGLGSGVNGNVRALAVNGSDLIAGGFFSLAGGKPSTNIGQYHLPLAQQAPAPTLTGLSPGSAVFGGPDFVLEVSGTNFSSRSVVRWKGTALTTTYVNGTKLRAIVPAAKIAAEGSAEITVFTPAVSGGGETGSEVFQILKLYAVFLPFAQK
jgi:hypothetical protein